MRMIKSIRLGCADLDKSRAFYDATFAAIGGPQNSAPAGYPIIMYRGEDSPVLILGKAANGEPTSHANGGTILFEAPTPESVAAWHAAGLAHGGTCEGKAEPKPQTGGKMGAYLRDPDGNKLGAYHNFPM